MANLNVSVDFVNGTNEEIAEAYYQRDLQMNLNFDNIKSKALQKLGYNNNSIQRAIEYRFMRHINDIIMQFNNNIVFDQNGLDLLNVNNLPNMFQMNMVEQFDEFRNSQVINSLINERQNRMNVLSNIDNHLAFYSAMTRAELDILGW